MAVRVGWFTAKNACCSAKMPSSSQTLSRLSAACAQNSAEVTIRPPVVISSSRRRSMTSASAPPHSPITISGTSPKTPVRPTIADELVIA